MAIKLIRRVPGQAHVPYSAATGQVDYRPVRKYRTEKKNAYSPVILHRRGEYREDEFTISIICTPAQYHALLAFMKVTGLYYLEYYSPAGTLRQFPIEFTSFPECPDDLHEYPVKIEFSAVSRYIGTPGYIDFNIITLCPDDDNFIQS